MHYPHNIKKKKRPFIFIYLFIFLRRYEVNDVMHTTSGKKKLRISLVPVSQPKKKKKSNTINFLTILTQLCHVATYK